jgi:hypothetical protein
LSESEWEAFTLSDRLQSILAPLAQANGLANEHYTDIQVHDIEKKALFFDTWAGLSVGSEIPEIGDAKPRLETLEYFKISVGTVE